MAAVVAPTAASGRIVRRMAGTVRAACRTRPQIERMAESLPLAAVPVPLQSLVRRAARKRERVTITDHDEPAAVHLPALVEQLRGLHATLDQQPEVDPASP